MTIARIWRGRAANAEHARAYERHFADEVAPHLAEIAGFRGARLLRRETEGGVEVQAVTFWESMAAIEAFAGPDPEVAVVAPAARAVLSDFDGFVTHWETVFEAGQATELTIRRRPA